MIRAGGSPIERSPRAPPPSSRGLKLLTSSQYPKMYFSSAHQMVKLLSGRPSPGRPGENERLVAGEVFLGAAGLEDRGERPGGG
jgi:hypothetical protein